MNFLLLDNVDTRKVNQVKTTIEQFARVCQTDHNNSTQSKKNVTHASACKKTSDREWANLNSLAFELCILRHGSSFLLVADCKLQIANCKLQTANCKLLSVLLKLILMIEMVDRWMTL